jgi:hypothetical protein
MATSKIKSFITYLTAEDHMRLKRFAKQKKLAMTQLVREGILIRLAEGSEYVSGFNSGLNAAIETVKTNPAFQMKFPSGQSFEDLLINELSSKFIQETK